MLLTYIILQGDKEGSLFSCRIDSKKSSVLYSVAKERIPNAIVSLCFKKHHEIMDKRPYNEELSSLFFFLPSIMARKEKINQFHDNFDLNCTDCSLDYLNSFSFDKVDFQPHLLNCSDAEKRDLPVELLYNFFRQMGETSNVNLICNVDYFLASTKE